MDDFVSKPTKFGDVRAALDRVLDREVALAVHRTPGPP